MIWQDLLFSGGSMVLAINLLPTMLNEESAIPRRTSIPTAAVLTMFTFGYFTLGLTISAAVTAITVAFWTFIAIYRST